MSIRELELPLPSRVVSWNTGELHITWSERGISLLICPDGQAAMGPIGGSDSTEQFINRLLSSPNATNS